MVLLSTVTTTSFQPRCWYSFFLWTPPLSLTFASAPSSWWRLNTAVLRDLSVRLLHFEWKHAAAGMLLKRLASAHCWERHASSSQVANVASGGAAVNVPSVHQWLFILALVPALVAGGGGMEVLWGTQRGKVQANTDSSSCPNLSSSFFLFFWRGAGSSYDVDFFIIGCAKLSDSWWDLCEAPVGSVLLGVSMSVCALLSDNNPNHFSPMLSPPARSGRYTTSAVFAF